MTGLTHLLGGENIANLLQKYNIVGALSQVVCDGRDPVRPLVGDAFKAPTIKSEHFDLAVVALIGIVDLVVSGIVLPDVGGHVVEGDDLLFDRD